jgi:hypothetical protein
MPRVGGGLMYLLKGKKGKNDQRPDDLAYLPEDSQSRDLSSPL